MTTKTVQEIASTAKDPAGTWEARRLGELAPGKAQQTILDALGVEANNYAHAKEIFKALGIVVIPKRVGRRSVPVVTKLDRSGGAMNQYHEGEEWGHWGPDVDLSAIKDFFE